MPWASSAGSYGGPGVFDMPATVSPYAPKPRPLVKRKTPGDPRCPDCRAAKRGYCAEHKTFHYVTHATAGVA
jgi:hypothetical protein